MNGSLGNQKWNSGTFIFINQRKIVRHSEDCRLAAVFVFVYWCTLLYLGTKPNLSSSKVIIFHKVG